MAIQNNTRNGTSRDTETNNSYERSNYNNHGGRQSGTPKKKKNKSGDWLTNLFLILLVVTIIVLLLIYVTGQKKPKDQEELPPASPTPTIAVPVTPEPTPTQEDKPDEPINTEKPVPTKGYEKEETVITPTPFATPESSVSPQPTEELSTPTPEPTTQEEMPQPTQDAEEEPPVSMEEAEKIIQDAFWEAGEDYRFVLSDRDLTLDSEVYYCYKVYYRNKAEDYSVLVARKNGRMYYYNDGVKTDYDGLLRDPEGAEINEEQAKELLSDIPAESLMLPAPLEECNLSLDNWKTVVDGADCYCLNVFYNNVLAGSIYFTELADKVYYLDEFGEFVKVK